MKKINEITKGKAKSMFTTDNEDNLIILLYPISFNANNGNKPMVSSNLKFI